MSLHLQGGYAAVRTPSCWLWQEERPAPCSATMRSSLAGLPVLLMLAPWPASCAVDLNCQIFDETMVCDNEKTRLHRAEIRTCSG